MTGKVVLVNSYCFFFLFFHALSFVSISVFPETKANK